MTFTVIDCEQRSEAWHQARLGRLTASRAADMLATIKSGEAAARRNLRVQLVLERLTGKPQESAYLSPAMQQGIEREADAQAVYEMATGRILRTCGFLAVDDLLLGASLDGYVGDFEGVVEIKCPTPAIHLEYVKSGKVPADYLAQITHQLMVTGARWADFVSFNPDFPEPLRVKLVRVERDEAAITAYQQKACAFLADVDLEYHVLTTAIDGVHA